MNSNNNKTSNNKYFDCPARMDDGRAFTDYRPRSTVDNMIRVSNNIKSSYEYRQFLIHNATKIMDVTDVYTEDKVGCNSCNYKPMQFYSDCNITSDSSECNIADPDGMGINNIAHFSKQ